MRSLVAGFVAAALVLAGCTSSPPDPDPAAPPDVDPAAAADLDVLLERLEAIHPEPFHGIPRTEFVAALRDVQDRLPELSAEQTTVEVMRLVALLSRSGRDGHQFALPQEGHEGPVLPLRLYEFADGVFVTAARAPYENLVGSRILEIADRPIEDVLAAVEPLVPRDGPATVPAFRPIFVLRTEVLRGLGIAGNGAIDMTVVGADGERRVPLDPVAFTEYVEWAGGFGMMRLPERAATPYLADLDRVLRFDRLGSAVWIRYLEVRRPDPAVLADVRAAVTGEGVQKVVLDLRQNPGGDNHNNAAIIALLTDFRAAHPAGPIAVITDRVTFSAAANLATDVERQFAPVFVGEPMGGGLNFWNDVTQLRLHHLPTPLQVGISTRYWQRSDAEDPRLTIQPTVPVPVTAEDYFADVDPALTAALAA